MDLTNQSNSSLTPKGFWNRKEGVTGYLFLGIIGFAIFWFWGTIVPFVFATIQDTVGLIVWGAVLLGLIYAILDGRVRATVAFLFQEMMRKMTSWVTDVYPIEIMRNYIRTLQKHCDEIRESMSKLQGAITALQRTMNKNKEDIDHAIALGNQAKQQGKMDLAGLNGNTAARLAASNEKYIPILEKQQKLYQVLDKVYKASNFMVQDKTNEVDTLEIEFKTLKAGTSAIDAAKKIFKGSAEKDLYEEAAAKLEMNMSNQIGAMNDFMSDIKGTLDNIDLENGIMNDKGLAMLDKISNADYTVLLNNDKSSNAPEKILIPVSRGGSSPKVADNNDLSNLI